MGNGSRPRNAGDAFAAAIAMHQKGRLGEAEAAYRTLLRADPGHAGALHMLGLAHLQRGDAATAARLIGESVGRDGRNAFAYNNLGAALLALRRFDEALAAFDRASALRPDHAEALNNAGNALVSLGRAREALERYEAAMRLGPPGPTLLYNRAIALQKLGRLDEALAGYDAALALQPGYADAHGNRGEALRLLKRYGEAIESFDRAIALNPDHAQSLNSRGAALYEIGRLEEALSNYERAIRLDPGFIDAFENLVKALNGLGRHRKSLEFCERAIPLEPRRAALHFHRAMALFGLGRTEEASQGIKKALELDPDLPYGLGMGLHFRMLLCEWTDFESDSKRVIQDATDGRRSAPPLALLSLPAPEQALLQCARTYARDTSQATLVTLRDGGRVAHDRIRVSYLSADFREHPVAHLISEVLERHDRSRFEVTAISFGPGSDDPWRRRITQGVDRLIDVAAMSDEEAVAKIRGMEIDIAVDLMGFTLGARTPLLAMRCAPIQVNYLGFPCTMGAEFMDYIVADATVIPPGHERFFAEKLALLPNCYLPRDSTREVSDRHFTRAELNLPESAIVFCCFNSTHKITPDAFDTWMRLLDKVPQSVLWLRSAPETARDNLCRSARNSGISDERLVFADRMDDIGDHYARHRAADIFLDTFHYNAHTTASDALWSGLPVVTLMGNTFASRVAASQLRAIGLPELIARSESEYEAIALELAGSRERLAAIRSRLTANRQSSPLFDSSLYLRHLEAAFATMVERHRKGLPPQSFAVPA